MDPLTAPLPSLKIGFTVPKYQAVPPPPGLEPPRVELRRIKNIFSAASLPPGSVPTEPKPYLVVSCEGVNYVTYSHQKVKTSCVGPNNWIVTIGEVPFMADDRIISQLSLMPHPAW